MSTVPAPEPAIMLGGRLLAARMPAEPLCNVCGAQVIAEGLEVCFRHVIHELGITYQELNSWVMRGYLCPEERAPGSGMPRRWPPAEVEVAKRMARLTAAGLPAELAAGFARDSWPAGEISPGIRIAVDEETGAAR